MDTINVKDLPEPVARAIAETVANLREELNKEKTGSPSRIPVWPLGVIGTLTREDIYEHLDDQV